MFTINNLKMAIDVPQQTVIRLLIKAETDQGLHCSFFAGSILQIQSTLITSTSVISNNR